MKKIQDPKLVDVCLVHVFLNVCLDLCASLVLCTQQV